MTETTADCDVIPFYLHHLKPELVDVYSRLQNYTSFNLSLLYLLFNTDKWQQRNLLFYFIDMFVYMLSLCSCPALTHSRCFSEIAKPLGWN